MDRRHAGKISPPAKREIVLGLFLAPPPPPPSEQDKKFERLSIFEQFLNDFS